LDADAEKDKGGEPEKDWSGPAKGRELSDRSNCHAVAVTNIPPLTRTTGIETPKKASKGEPINTEPVTRRKPSTNRVSK
jgi:hypothetical protein